MPRRLRRALGLLLAAGVLLGAAPVAAQDLLARFEKQVTEFTLANGLKFIIVEDHDAPIVSVHTYADVGSVDEVKGITGLAHIFEHMAFKGTTRTGTRDIQKELEAIRREDEAYHRLKAARYARADTAEIARLEAAFAEATNAAKALAQSAESDEVIDREGGVGVNATTGPDVTQYFYSLPSNKIELWFSLESDRFFDPVLREFYQERDVVMEERRMRIESNPIGRVMEEFVATAFKAHPYGEPIGGHMSDLETVTREEAIAFFKKFYGANNLTIALVGDVQPQEMRRMAETYFGRLPAGEKPAPVETAEPEQNAERRVIVEDQAQPFVAVGWHKGSMHHPDNPVFDVLSDILSNGRTSRLYKTLVERDRVAQDAGGFGGFPGQKYPNLFLAYAFPNQGRTAEEAEQAIYAVIEQIEKEGVTQEELARAKTRARANLIRSLADGESVGMLLTSYQALTGDWRNAFRELDRIEAVSSADIQRVVRETFTPRNRTVALIRTAEPTAQAN